MERFLSWPSNATNSALAFDYYVDSEAGFDFLNVYVDGLKKFSKSGTGQMGRARIPVSAGTHKIRVEYYKDTSVDRGLDLAAVDNVAAVAGNLPTTDRESFSQRVLGTPQGWTSGGSRGGWETSPRPFPAVLARPGAQAFWGYQAPGSSSKSHISRALWFPVAGYVTFRYLVDSEACCDYLRVYVDGTQKFSISGVAEGVKTIPVPSGSHTIKFEYHKDYSVDSGTDLALVDDVVFSAGTTFEHDMFDGYKLNAAPVGWTAGGTGPGAGGWVITRKMASRLYAIPASASEAPIVDGVISPEPNSKEYPLAAMVDVPDFGLTQYEPARFAVHAVESTQTIYLAARVTGATPSMGDESIAVYVAADVEHDKTLASVGCGSPGNPGSNDRLIGVAYNIAAGTSQPQKAIYQYVGTCAGGWAAAGTNQMWPVSVAISENTDKPGMVDIELSLVPGSASGEATDVFMRKKLGLVAMVVSTNSAATTPYAVYRLPFMNEVVPDFGDARTWQTVILASPNDIPYPTRLFNSQIIGISGR